ncbi:uncharacterized protein LOC127648006 [Xyrauchen texanus]|uniref:uncharacterized protein LOC127648006 n=1 Tax=Xyrauchen texanus TaxID=154827 RepID=UPI0022424463|nr:uncharacterized protein LOC127648006 [Xyrauchen texanus]XP_051988522.1 uncharacterized protein LOC127648006 [Xyrauchen texanus]
MHLSGVAVLLLLHIQLGSAEQIEPKVLKTLVKDFLLKNVNAHIHLDQMSFMIGLTPDQCNGKSSVNYLYKGEEKQQPTFTKSVKDFNTKLKANYIAVGPDPGQYCSEFKILKNPTNGWDPPLDKESMTGAEWLGVKLEQTLQNGGCMVFYTTNSPCLEHCFSDNCDRRIDEPLSKKPFSLWREEGKVHMYFIYTQLFDDESDVETQQKVKEGFSNLRNLGFTIEKCPYQQKLSCPQCKGVPACTVCLSKTTFCNNCKDRMNKCQTCKSVDYQNTCNDCPEFKGNCMCNKIPKERQVKCKACKNHRNYCLNCKKVYCDDCTSKVQSECLECEIIRERDCQSCRNSHLDCYECLNQRIECQVEPN